MTGDVRTSGGLRVGRRKGRLATLSLIAFSWVVGVALAERTTELDREPSPEYSRALALLQSGQREEAGRLIRSLAEDGDRDAQYFLGNIYFYPEYGVQDFERAFYWFQSAARQGHVEATHKIGIMYSRGSYVVADKEKAVAWYKKAAEAGSAPAQFDLAYRYQSGRGARQDLELARFWYGKAAAQGLEVAKENLRLLNAYGIQSAEPPAFSRLRNAAAEGDAEAQWRLFQIYSEGRVLKPHPEKARHWLAEAATNRHPEAIRLVIRSGFFQGCFAGCVVGDNPALSCAEDCRCIIDRLEERHGPNELADRMTQAMRKGGEEALVELIGVARLCGGIRV